MTMNTERERLDGLDGRAARNERLTQSYGCPVNTKVLWYRKATSGMTDVASPKASSLRSGSLESSVRDLALVSRIEALGDSKHVTQQSPHERAITPCHLILASVSATSDSLLQKARLTFRPVPCLRGGSGHERMPVLRYIMSVFLSLQVLRRLDYLTDAFLPRP